MGRYDDQPEYGRPRDAVRRNDGRDVRRAIDPSDRSNRPMEREYLDDPMDMRVDQRPEPRAANTGTRVERPVRGIELRGDRGDRGERDDRGNVLYRDPITGELYRDFPNRRTPYEDEFDNLAPSSRPIVVSAPDSGQSTRATYAEYFLPGEGIEREVIQAEICRYLGQDATCKPGKDPQDGRPGFLIRAYRAPTSEMIRSLRDSSNKFRGEEKYWADKNRQQRRPDVIYQSIQDNHWDRDTMDVDDDRAYVQPGRYARDNRDIDPRNPRNTTSNRPFAAPPTLPPVTSAYPPDPGYPGYTISTPSNISQMGQMGGYEPRSFASPGNTTPPSAFRSTGFPTSEGLPRTTQPPSVPMSAPSYVDPRTGKVVNTYPTYPADTRHRR